jgi:hypothetical protein
MYLEKRTVEWLLEVGALAAWDWADSQQGVLLAGDQEQEVENGLAVAKVIAHKYSGMRAIVEPMASLKASSSQSAKVFNWNLIWAALRQAKMEFEEEFKSLVLAGDNDLIQELLTKLQDKNPL